MCPVSLSLRSYYEQRHTFLRKDNLTVLLKGHYLVHRYTHRDTE